MVWVEIPHQRRFFMIRQAEQTLCYARKDLVSPAGSVTPRLWHPAAPAPKSTIVIGKPCSAHDGIFQSRRDCMRGVIHYRSAFKSFLSRNKADPLTRVCFVLACPKGFEPSTFRVGVWRAIQLCHGQKLNLVYYITTLSEFQLKKKKIPKNLSKNAFSLETSVQKYAYSVILGAKYLKKQEEIPYFFQKSSWQAPSLVL